MLFEGHVAVLWRGQYVVVLDRNLLPKKKANGESYYLANTKHRWIVYHYAGKWSGEWNTWSAKRTALASAQSADRS